MLSVMVVVPVYSNIGDLRQEHRFLTPLLHNTGYRVVTGETVLVDGVGHYPQTEIPVQVASGIIAFLHQADKR